LLGDIFLRWRIYNYSFKLKVMDSSMRIVRINVLKFDEFECNYSITSSERYVPR
jgi:hypothetical protein